MCMGARRHFYRGLVSDTPLHTGFAFVFRGHLLDSFTSLLYYKMKTSAVRSTISSKLIFASCVGYFDRADYGLYVTSSRMLVFSEGDKI